MEKLDEEANVSLNFIFSEANSQKYWVHAEAVPGVFTYLGIRNETVGSVHGLHTPRFTLDEGVLPRGAALHAAVALEFFKSHHLAVKEEL